jgi:protein TonB
VLGGLAECRRRLGDFLEARRLALEALAADPRDVYAHVVLGEMGVRPRYQCEVDRIASIEHLERALAVEPTYAPAHYHLWRHAEAERDSCIPRIARGFLANAQIPAAIVALSRAVLESAPPGAVVIEQRQPHYLVLRALQVGEGLRPEVPVISPFGLETESTRELACARWPAGMPSAPQLERWGREVSKERERAAANPGGTNPIKPMLARWIESSPAPFVTTWSSGPWQTRDSTGAFPIFSVTHATAGGIDAPGIARRLLRIAPADMRASWQSGQGGLADESESDARAWLRDQSRRLAAGLRGAGAGPLSDSLDAWRLASELDSLSRSSSKPESEFAAIGEYVFVEELPEMITRSAPAYPEAARRANLEGTVIVQALVGKDGVVKDVCLRQSIPGLDLAALGHAMSCQFRPARANGKPIAVWVAIPVRFSLR